MVKGLCVTSSGLMLLLAGCGTGGGAPDDSTVGATPALEVAAGSVTAVLTSELEPAINSAGIAATVTTTGTIDRTNSFFQPLGTNPRTCETCHGSGPGMVLDGAGGHDSLRPE